MGLSTGPLRSLWLADAGQLAGGPAVAPDAIIVEVAPCREPGAALALLARARASTPRVLAGLSPLGAGRVDAELDAVLPGLPDGVVLPRCADGREVQRCGVKLAVREAEAGREAGSVAILALVGPGGLLALDSFGAASRRLAGFALDPAGEFGPGGDEAGDAGDPASVMRALLVLGARDAGVPAFAAVAGGLTAEALRHACLRARRFGFAGAITRDAAAIGTINEVFGGAPGG